MADVILRMDSGHGETCVPDLFIDEYMPAADGEFVKVYLYLLRCMKDPDKVFSVKEAATGFGCSFGRILDALKYWEHVGLLRLDFDSAGELSCVSFTRRLTAYTPISSGTSSSALSGEAEAVYSKPNTVSSGTGADVSSEISECTYREPDFSMNINTNTISDADRRELLMIAETYIGRPLSPTEVYKLYDWIDKFGLPAEVIDYLIDYCVTHGHTAFSYMDKIAVAWADSGIDTLAKAKDRTKDFDSSKTYDAVRKAFGIAGRNLVESEKNYIRVWAIDLSMSDDLISLACERTILKTSRASFEFADRILRSWHENKVSSTDDVNALDEKYRAQNSGAKGSGNVKSPTSGFSAFESRGYKDSAIEDIEKALLKV